MGAPTVGPCTGPASPVAGILLTGGASRRMGFDKARLPVDGVPLGARLGRLLQGVVAPVVEVGPGVSWLPALQEDPPGQGPLVAMCAGACRLGEMGHAGPVLVLACDLPFMTSAVLAELAAWPPARSSVVPVVAGRPQPLCARWSQAALGAAYRLADQGERAMKCLFECADVVFLDEKQWGTEGVARAFADVDSPADLKALGLRPYA